ncbi:MAG: hypothetical protein LBN35_03490 [Clostridiales Family XIII bacterium]|jgi:hypothetical protein|nr:hypothetical protein [Clostridiales Family XIII bacterium]
MLGKIIRYEFKSTARLFLLMYAALIVMAAINMLIIPWNEDVTAVSANPVLDATRGIFNGLFIVMYILLAVATAVVTTVIIVIRFYRLLGDQGYLWFTLPVTTNQHILAKLIAGIVWSVASFVAIVLSLLVLFARLNYFDAIADVWQRVTAIGFNLPGWIAVMLLSMLVGAVSNILVFYASISLGPHITKSRLGGSVIAYIIAYVIMQIVATVASLITFSAASRVDYELEAMESMPPDAQVSDAFTAGFIETLDQVGAVSFGIGLATSVIFAVAGYIITHRMLTKKLNLA